jgi:hypothetical protein
MTPSITPDTEARLQKICAAAEKRTQTRKMPDAELFAPDDVPASLWPSLRFFVSQLTYLEAIGPRNLRTLAKATDIPALKHAYVTQIDDEIAHAAMFREYRDEIGDTGRSGVVAFGSWAGIFLQRDPWLGAVCVMATTEFLAGQLMPALRERTPEPRLAALLAEIERDEHRHRALAITAARATAERGLGHGSFNRARRRAAQSLVDLFFDRVLGRVFSKHAAALDLPVKEIYARAREDLEEALFPTQPPG